MTRDPGLRWAVLLLSVSVALSACVSSPGPEATKSSSSPSPAASPSSSVFRPSPAAATSPGPGKTKAPAASATPAPIPAGSAALFYPTGLGSVQSRLPVQVQYTDPEGGGYATNIRWSTSSSAIVRDIPALNRVDIVSTSVSPSYATNAVYPFTAGGRLFTLTDWRADWTSKNAQWDLNEFDPVTGKATGGMTTFQASSFAVAGDKLYFRSPLATDLFGKVTGGGQLNALSLGQREFTTNTRKLLDRGDPSNSGSLYGVGDHLLSVIGNGTATAPTLTIRSHDLQTGAATTLHSSIAQTPNLYNDLFPGHDGLYHLTQSGRTITVTHYPVAGSSKALISVDLEGNETGIQVAEDKGKLLILALSNVRFTSAQVYDLATGEVSALKISPFGQPVSYGRIGVAFLVM